MNKKFSPKDLSQNPTCFPNGQIALKPVSSKDNYKKIIIMFHGIHTHTHTRIYTYIYMSGNSMKCKNSPFKKFTDPFGPQPKCH